MDCSTVGFSVLHCLQSEWICSNSCPLSQWCYLNISFYAIPLSSCPRSFPEAGSFPMSQLFASGGQSIGASASASVLPVNSQGWFLLGLTGLISLQSKGLSRVFSNTTIQKHQFFGTQPFYDPTFTSIHDAWKNCSFIWTFVSKEMYLLFNMLSRFVTAFLPRSKRLFCSDFWAQENKSVTVSIVSPSICH